MRIIVYGVGAVGGTIAAALTLAGHEVVGIARGAQLEIVQRNGLRLHSADQNRVARFECVGRPSEINFQPDDIVLLCVKSQDTSTAFEQLQKAGMERQPVFCAQNGIANEREALRYFPNVHGITVMMPAMFLHPGEVAVFGQPNFGILDVGRVPLGLDTTDRNLVTLLNSANFAANACEDVMALKRSKLLLNLGNVVQAALGLSADSGDFFEKLRMEAETVYRARGLTWKDVSKPDPRLAEHMQVAVVPGIERVGGSTLQSLLRNTGTIETNFLNGEIVLQGQLAGIETPLNSAMTRLGAQLQRENVKPGSMTLGEVNRMCR